LQGGIGRTEGGWKFPERQKAGELDDKLTSSKPIRKPLLTQVWDKDYESHATQKEINNTEVTNLLISISQQLKNNYDIISTDVLDLDLRIESFEILNIYMRCSPQTKTYIIV
jgi:hypothetical protein